MSARYRDGARRACLLILSFQVSFTDFLFLRNSRAVHVCVCMCVSVCACVCVLLMQAAKCPVVLTSNSPTLSFSSVLMTPLAFNKPAMNEIHLQLEVRLHPPPPFDRVPPDPFTLSACFLVWCVCVCVCIFFVRVYVCVPTGTCSTRPPYAHCMYLCVCLCAFCVHPVRLHARAGDLRSGGRVRVPGVPPSFHRSVRSGHSAVCALA